MKNIRLLALALAIFTYKSADAQRYMTPVAGVNLSTFTPEFSGESPSVSSLLTPRFGVMWDIELPKPLPNGWYIRTGMLYNGKGYKINYSTEVDGKPYTVDGTFRINYAELPVMAAYRRTIGKVSVYGATGPYYALALLGKQTFKLPGIDYPGTDTDTDIEFYGKNDANPYKNYEFGWNVGVGVEYRKIQLNLNYAIGMTNVANTGGDKLKSSTFSVTLGYMFDLGSSRPLPEAGSTENFIEISPMELAPESGAPDKVTPNAPAGDGIPGEEEDEDPFPDYGIDNYDGDTIEVEKPGEDTLVEPIESIFNSAPEDSLKQAPKDSIKTAPGDSLKEEEPLDSIPDQSLPME